MPFTDPLEPENTETTPLLSSEDRHPSLTRRKKLERIARMLGRVFNPLHDAAIAGLILIMLQVRISAYKEDEYVSFFPPYVFISALGLTSFSSFVFEITNLYQLSKHSRFILGENYYEHTKILTQELTAVLGSDVVSFHRHFERWTMELKQCSNEVPIKKLLRDFEIVNRYNHFRKAIDTISVLVLGIWLLNLFFYAFAVLGPKRLLPISTSIVMGIFFLIKTCFDRIEHNWPQYENSWKKLSLSRRKSLLFFRNIIEGLYHFILATSVFGLSTALILKCSFAELICFSILSSDSTAFNLIAIPFSAIYMSIQLINEHRFNVRSNIYRHLKRGTQGILEGAKTISMLTILSSLIFIGIIQAPNMSIYYIAIPLISGLVTTVNTILNYQEPDPNMMSTVDHEVSKLREEIVDIKEKMLEETGHERHGGVNTAMHDKSEIGLDPQDAPLENTQKSTDRSLLSAFCCFWGRSKNNNEDTMRTHASGSLRETVTFQKV